MKTKQSAILIGIIALLVAFAYKAYVDGQNKRFFDYQPFAKTVYVPILVDDLEASAEPAGPNRIRVTWGKVFLPENPQTPYLTLLGKLRPIDITYYLFELDGQLYLEKEEFAEVLLHAIYAKHAGMDSPKPTSIQDLISLLPDDQNALKALASGFNKRPRSDFLPSQTQ